jgi:hypothetical protein
MHNRYLFILLFVLCAGIGLRAQVFYGLGGNVLFSFAYVDGVCQTCQVQTLNDIDQGFNGDLFVLPNGDIIVTSGTELHVYSLPNPNPIATFSGLFVTGTAIGPNGLVYLIGITNNISSLYTYDPVTNTVNYIGDFPAGSTLTDLFYFNGQLYASGQNVFLVNVSNPSASVLQTSSISPDAAVADEGFYIGLNFGSIVFGQFNPITDQKDILCTLTPPVPGSSLQQVPASAPPPPLCCTTDAGTLSGGPFNICGTGPVNFSAASGVVLDGNDLLRYILFTNPSDTLGSIIATSSTPSFSFNPATMQTGVTYYIAAIAGNNNGGNVNLNDPCLDISNALTVIWRPLPSVTFAVANPNVCSGGCTSVTATFTGTSPFTLTYIIPGSGPQTQTFSGNTGTFQVCVPAGAPAGSFQIAATKVVDRWCTCE